MSRGRQGALGALAMLVVLVAAVALGQVVYAPHHPRLRRPVAATAIVTDTFINGIAGDPAVRYRYQADGRSFTGSAISGFEYSGTLRVGDRLRIRLDADKPSHSCAC